MCKIRAHHFACGHTSRAHVSICRVTYANPEGTLPLCRAEPSITISHDNPCRACQYDTFRKKWEERIDEAHKRREAAIESFQHRRHDDDSWFAIEFDDGINGSGDVKRTRQEAADLKRETAHYDREIERLVTQYHEEQAGWRKFFERPKSKSFSGIIMPSKPQKPMRPGRRCSGESPLKKSITAEDLTDLPVPNEAAIDEDELDSDPSGSPESMSSSLSSNSFDASPPPMSFGWGDMMSPQDEKSFADSLAGALGELNTRTSS